MKKAIGFMMCLLLTACAPRKECVEPPAVPTVVISGHYSETLRNDPETMRRAMEMQSVISKEGELCPKGS